MYNSFYGWYLKCQPDTWTLAIIPAVHNVPVRFRLSRTIMPGQLCSLQIHFDGQEGIT